MNQRVLRFSLLLALCASPAFADHTETTAVPRIPFFHGMGFNGYTTGERAELTDPATYTGLAAKGFDYVRLPIDFRKCSSYNSGTGVCTLNENATTTTTGGWGGWGGQTTTVLGFSSFDVAIDAAEAAGQYIIIGFYNWDNMDPTDESQRAQFKATWRAVAERYQNRSNRLVFELAHRAATGTSDNTKLSKFNTLQKEAIAIIRQTNPTRLILYSAPDGSNPWVLTANNWWVAPPTDDNNVAVSITTYTPSEFCDQSYSQVRLTSSHISSLNWDLAQIKTFRQNRGFPVVLTEFGPNHTRADHGDVTTYLSKITRYCEANGIPWSPYEYYAGGAKDCCDSSGELLDFVKAGLFPDLTTVDDFDPASYDKAMEITFPGYSGTTALANFPVLVKLSEDDIYGFLYSDFQKADGSDLCFTDAAGNLLAHEIDTWNPSGVSTVWVKVPSLTASTTITAHYGCTNPVLPKVESVWDADYVGVWHMGEQALPLADSTGVSRDATSADGTGIGYGSAGIVGNAVNFGAASSSRSVNMDDHNALDGFATVTIEAWTKPSTHAANAGIVSKRNYSGSGGSLSYYMFDDGTATTMSYSPDGSSVVSAGVALQPVVGQWNHQAFTLDATAASSNSMGYLNGALAGTDDVSCPGGIFAGQGELHVGNLHSGNAANFPGLIDEVRISKCVRSADWIKTSRDTVAKAGFASYEVLGSGGHNPTLTVDVAAGATTTLGTGGAVVEEWTRRIVKTGGGTLVVSPLSETSVSSLQVEDGMVKLAASAPASVASTLGNVSFEAGTALDLSGKSYAVAEISGSPVVLDAATFTLNGGWTLQGTNAMSVAGSLAFGQNANIALENSALFADVTHAGVAIATATGEITGMPSIAGDDFELAISADGKTLLLCSTTPDEPDWTAFSKSFTLTFGGYAGGAALADFPVLVRLSPGNVSGFRYSDFRKENGGDLRFSDENGNLIPHEIDTWDTSDESTVWVKVPTLTSSTQITAHYGCARPVRPLNPKGVWSNGYAGVWHLGEGAPTLEESSGASTGFSSSNGAGIGYAASGIVSGAVDFGDTGGSRRLDADDHDALDGFDAFTVEMWTWQTRHVTGSGDRATGLIAKRNAYDDQMSWFVHDNGSNYVLSVTSSGLHGTTKAAELVSPALGTWQHVAFAYDSGAADGKYFKGYLEGLFTKSSGQNAGRVFAGSGDLHLGCLGLNDTRNFPGRIDEVRISNVARSADWVRASHDTVADADFATCSRVASAAFDPNSRLVVYPEYPAQIERDYAYGVTATQGDTTTNLVVYNHCEKSPLADRTHGGDVNRRFCEFAFSGDPVRVDIAVCEDVQSYKVFPARLNLQSSFDAENGVISVWLDTPHSFGIELNDSVKSILSVLVDEPEDPADVPSPGDAGVLYIAGWMDAPGPDGILAISNQCSEVYIAPGAVLNARLYLKKSGVRVHGRGMILDPFSDIFRYDQINNTKHGVLNVQATGVTVEDIKIVDAREFNYISYYGSTTFRNIKALSTMMCTDGITYGAKNGVVEGAWLYVGDNGLVVGQDGSCDGRFSDIVIGTSCKAVFPQGNNTGIVMENIDVFRADEGLISNVHNPSRTELNQNLFFRNISGVDCTLFPRFFAGANMGTLPKTFGFENVSIPQSTGSSTWQSIGRSGKALTFYDDTGKPWTTSNYVFSITNLWVAGSRSDGFPDSAINNPDRVSISVVNNLVAPKIPAVPNRTEVNWTCPWKRYIGLSLQRDVRLATPAAGEQRLTEPYPAANLLADRNATRSVWQRHPSWQVKLDATTFDPDNGARIYRTRESKATDTGMYCDITDGFLRRGNGTYTLTFDARADLTNAVDQVTIQAKLLSNEKDVMVSFTAPNDGEWHQYTADIETTFDMEATDLVGLHIRTPLNCASEIDYKNLSFVKSVPEVDPTAFAKEVQIAFTGYSGAELTNFPALVRLSQNLTGFSYADFSQPDGGDLRFFDASGNLLAHEIDTWNPAGISTIWVKVPRLTSATVVTAKYGCLNPPAVDARVVWDDDYVGVWHLGETALPMKESSGTTTSFSTANGSGIGYAAAGVAGGAVDFSGGTGCSLVAPDHDMLDGFTNCTLEVWTQQDERKNSAGVLSKRASESSDAAYYIRAAATSMPLGMGTSKTVANNWVVAAYPTLEDWNHLAYTIDTTKSSGNLRSYKNGAATETKSKAFSGPMLNSESDLVLGNFSAIAAATTFNGRIDEVRISKTVRSAAWIKATHDTIMLANFATYAVNGAAASPGGDIDAVKLKASTDRANPVDYAENETITFNFVLDGVAALPDALRALEPLQVVWTRTGDDGARTNGSAVISLSQGCAMTTSLAIPGIVRLTAYLAGADGKKIAYLGSDGKTANITFGGGAGVATERMTAYADEPADFDAFWADAKAKLATVPFDDSNVELVDVTPSGAASYFTIYAAKIPCYGPRPVTGWLMIPKNVPAGGLPVQAEFDGYGCVSSAPSKPTWGVEGQIRFKVNAHGYDLVGQDNQYYKDFNDFINKTNRTFNGTTYTYGLAPQDYDNPTNTYFYYMALRAVRAFEYLKTRPEWDGTNVVALGGSQGGAQTMWAGGLVDGITQLRPSITWGCDIGCPWNGQGPYPSRTWGIPCVPGAYYFDAAFHAKRVPRNCTAEITRVGLGDYTSPPRGVILSYHNLKCAATAKLVQGSDHGYVPSEPNQTFTLSKAAVPDDSPEPPTPAMAVSETSGYDWTNRLFTVSGLAAGTTVTLTITGRDASTMRPQGQDSGRFVETPLPTATFSALADSTGAVSFDCQTTPGALYDYAIATNGVVLASGAFLAGSWDADGSWFLAAPDGAGGAVETNGAWTVAPAETNATHFVSGETAEFALSSNARATGEGRLFHADARVSYPQLDDLAILQGVFPTNDIAAVAPVGNPNGGDALWAAFLGGGWRLLSGGFVPQAETDYVVRLEGDFANATSPLVRLSVSEDEGATFTPLSDATTGAEWFAPSDATKSGLTSIKAHGPLGIATLRGTLANADVAEFGGVRYASLADALRAARRAGGGTVTLLTSATAPRSLATGVTIDANGHVLVICNDFRGTLFSVQ